MSSYGPKRSKKDLNRCSLCNRIIANERHVRCMKCPFFFQCLQCLSTNQENDSHSLDHEFLIVEPRPYPIFCQNWDVQDEILLLCGIKLFGIGNWNDIANYMKTKAALDIETHYTAIYINSPNAPFPLPEVRQQIPRPLPPTYDTKPVESCPSEAHEKHMSEKNKKEKTNAAEFNGYMQYRHEFEVDYQNDAENLVGKIEFKDGEETKQTFKNKISCLIAYNNILAERRFRTKVIEDSDIHHKIIKPSSKSEKELDPRLLGGFSQEEKEADSTIISIAPYYGYEKTQKLANAIHQKIQIFNKIKQRGQWAKCGIKSIPEGILYSNLQNCIKETKNKDKDILPVISDVGNWNEYIANFNRINEKNMVKNKDILLIQESQLCTKEKIDLQLYQAIKCLLIRESTLRPLRKQDAIAMDPNYTDALSKIYDLLVSLGIIINRK